MPGTAARTSIRSRPRWTTVFAASLAACALLLPSAGASAKPGGSHPGPPSRTVLPPDCGTAVYKADGTAWTCTFDDDFSGTALDTAKWTPLKTTDFGFHSGAECFVNSPNNISVGNGVLSLTARKEAGTIDCSTPSKPFTTQYTSGMVTTTGKFSQTYGRFAISASFPAATVAGLQSMLWMWPQNLATTNLAGEIDIAEEYSLYPDRAVPTLHYAYDSATVDPTTNTNVVTNNYCVVGDVHAFHEYALEWTPTTMTITYDGRACLVDNFAPSGTSPFDQPYYLLLTQALGIGRNAFTDGVTPLPATTQIDWVRAWK
jgi:beta-glucanase (GH16 family)